MDIWYRCFDAESRSKRITLKINDCIEEPIKFFTLTFANNLQSLFINSRHYSEDYYGVRYSVARQLIKECILQKILN